MIPADAETVQSALGAIPPASLVYDEWIRLMMAVHDAMPNDAGRAIFDRWCQADSDRYDEKWIQVRWKRLKSGSVTQATLWGTARDRGWKPPERNPDTQPPAPPTPEELAARNRAREQAEAAAAEERRKAQEAAAAEAARIWSEASEEGSSPYLERKKVRSHGCRFVGPVLIVPLRNAGGALLNVQRIMPIKPSDGGPDKLLLRGGLKKGLLHLCGDPEGAPVLLVAEGYATAASLHEATGYPCAMGIDAGNLCDVVRGLRGRYSAARVFVCADDDRATELSIGKNPGRDAAEKAARLVGTRPIVPEGLEGDESDFNDLHCRAGLEAVRAVVEAAIAADAARATEPTQPKVASGANGGPTSDDARPVDTEGPPDDHKPTKRRAARKSRSSDEDDGADGAGADLFDARDDGVWRYHPPNNGNDGGWRRVCDPLHAEALARDAQDGAASLVLRFDSIFGQTRRLILPMSELAGDGGAWRGKLADSGFPVPPDTHRRRWLGEYLATRRPERHARLTERTGWHGRAYVLPTETLCIGADAEPMLFVGERMTDGGCAVRSDTDKWRWLIGRHCATQSRLGFAVSLAFAAPLLAWAGGMDSGGFHLVGDSSCGKTTAARVAGSVWGGAGFMQRWRGTDNGIEAIAAAHSDLFLILDELAQLDPKAAGETAYMLGNGSGKVRASRTGGHRPRLSWRVLFLSAGEVGLADHMAEAGKKARAGQELRLVDIPADAGTGHGVFDHRGEFDDAGALARHLNDAAAKAFGAVGRAWLEHLTGRTDTLVREVRERMAEFERQAVPEAASGQVQRVGRRFALVAAAGEMATATGLTGWDVGQASAAVLRVFNAWIEARPAGIGLSEDAAMLRQARAWFELNGDGRFARWGVSDEDHGPRTMLRAGWRYPIKSSHGLDETERTEWRITPEVFKSEVARGFNEKAMLRLLDARGHLKKEGPNRFTACVKVPGFGSAQVYRVMSTLLEEGDD